MEAVEDYISKFANQLDRNLIQWSQASVVSIFARGIKNKTKRIHPAETVQVAE